MKYHPATMKSPTYGSFIPILAWANIDPSATTANPANSGRTRDAKRRRARSTMKNARSADATMPGRRHDSASRPVSIRSADPDGPSASSVSAVPSTPSCVPAVRIVANGERPCASITTTRPSATAYTKSVRGTTANAVIPLAKVPVRALASGVVSRWPSDVSIESSAASSARASTMAFGPWANVMARSFATAG